MADEVVVSKAPLWEQMPGETPKAYAAFCLYRDLAPEERSIDAAYRTTLDQTEDGNRKRTAPANWGQWSSDNRWVARAIAHDQHIDQERRARRKRQRNNLEDKEYHDYQRQLERWEKTFEAAKLHIRASQTTLDDGTIVNFMALNTREMWRLTKWREDITKQGRRALGMPERITQNEIDLSNGLPAALIYLPAKDSDQLPDESEDEGLPSE